MRKLTWISLLSILAASTHVALRADEPQTAGSDDAQPKATDASAASSDQAAPLSDFQVASWIILENDVQLRVSKFARDNARDDRVKEYARDMVDAHNSLISTLHADLGIPGKADGESEFSQVLTQIARRLSTARDASGKRPLRGRAQSALAPQAATERRQAKQEAGTKQEGSDRPHPPADDEEHLRKTATQQLVIPRDVRVDVNINRDNKLRTEVLPVLRENLPEILDIVGEALEGSDVENAGLAFIEFKRQLAEKYAQSMIEELKRDQPKNLDQAYLGYEIVAHLRMIDTIKVAKKSASPELRQTLDQNMATMQDHLQRVRELIGEVK